MNKVPPLFFALLFSASTFCLKAQPKNPEPTTQPYGTVSQEDLEMTSCDFERDANAEVLFDIGKITKYGLERHVRIKIFNEFGEKAANFKIEYPSLNSNMAVYHLQGETINLNDGKTEVTPLDKKAVYTEKTNRLVSTLIFTFPDVKAGSIIEFEYNGPFSGAWYFQNNIPTRYSEIQADLPLQFKFIPHVNQPYVKSVGESTDNTQTRALANIHSLPDEPFMGSKQNNLQRIEYVGTIWNYDTWPRIGELLSDYIKKDQFVDSHISGEQIIIKQAKSLKTDNEKIALIFDYVRDNLKWNNALNFLPDDLPEKTWDNKTGSSAEINWIVYHLLKKAGIKAYPFFICDKRIGKINPGVPNLFKLANMAVYIPVDSVTNYLLDATNKSNQFNVIPQDDLNTFGLCIDNENEDDNMKYRIVFIENPVPAIETGFFNAEIKPDGKMSGTADITSYSYNKINAMQEYQTDGEEKYIKYLCKNKNNVKISSIKRENMDVDSLPLIQHIEFGVDLTGSDENYIYFNTNTFNLMGENPFMEEDRFSDIDLGYMDNFSISGVYKLPSGFKTDALPKNFTIISPDQSIIFKRIVAEADGSVFVKYILNHKKTIYFIKDYQDLRGFYKKMYELLNEQVVLKKSG